MVHVVCVYIATNKQDGKQYVGQTLDFHRRRRQHFCNADNLYFENALQKYGENSFNFVVIEYPKDKLNYWENYWIEMCDSMIPNGYNLKTGGDACRLSEDTKRKIGNAHRGKKKSPEHCESLRKAHLGYKIPDITKQRMSEAHIGLVRSEEHRKNLSLSNKGKVLSDETRRKISLVQIGKKHSPETRRKMSEAHLRRNQKLAEDNELRSAIGGY